MSFFDDIKNLVLALEPSATVVQKTEFEHERETFNYTTDIVVVVNPNYSDITQKQKGATLITTRQINLKFLRNDNWDNRTFDNNSEQTEDDSLTIAEEMELLANSVIWNYLNSGNTILSSDQLISWSSIPDFKKTSNIYTGVNVTLTYPFRAVIRCS